MTGDARSLLGYLPVAIFALFMILRYRNIQKARRLRLGMLWIAPVIIVMVVTLALLAMQPSAMGWLVLICGLVVGALIGWQRGRMMRLHVEGEGENARIMMRQSPAALILIVALFFVRHALAPAYQGAPDHVHQGHPAAGAMLVTDGMLGLVVGVIVTMRLTLWLRARQVSKDHHEAQAREVFR